jgi:putative transposase
MVGPAAKREAVAHLRTQFEMSERRATALVGADRTMIRYAARRPDDTVLRARLRDLAHQRHRFGYLLYQDSLIRTHGPNRAGRWT